MRRKRGERGGTTMSRKRRERGGTTVWRKREERRLFSICEITTCLIGGAWGRQEEVQHF